MSIEDVIRTRYPYLLAKRYEYVQLVVDSQLQVFRLIDLFEETVRYLALTGLAQYIHFDLSNDLVDKYRRSLERPSLGHWVGLMRSVSAALKEENMALLDPPLNQIYHQGPLYEAVQVLAPMIGKEMPKKVRVIFFLETLVEFRNKKIGHGPLSPWEAKRVVDPLNAGLSFWLECLKVLQTQRIMYINKVEWTGTNFLYIGHDLSIGTSIFPVSIPGANAIHPRQVYLGKGEGSSDIVLIPLYPFFAYTADNPRLYIYNELSHKGFPLLRCFHAFPVDHIEHILEASSEQVLGEQNILNDIEPDLED